MRSRIIFLILAVVGLGLIIGTLACSGGSGGPGPTFNTGGGSYVSVSMSDPPTCAGPAGPYGHVYVTISDVQINTSATAGPTDAGWVDLTPSLKSAPQQVDLLGTPNNSCFLAQLSGAQQVATGTYQQVRVYLAANNISLANNKCFTGNNCVQTSDGAFHALDLSSEITSGIKIPAAQMAGGGFTLAAGQTKNLNLDFDACASLVAETSGSFRLKPVMHAGEVSATASSISGRLLDSATAQPIAGGNAIVALEQKDANSIDRVVMQTTPDSQGNFTLCPVPAGTYDVVAVAVNGSNTAYAATITLAVQPGTALGSISLHPQTGVNTASATITGQVTSTSGVAVDVMLSALQPIYVSGAPVQFTIPLAQQSSSTATVTTASGASCASGVNCAQYSLALPAAQPYVGTYASTGTNYTQASGSNYSVEGQAFSPGTGSTPDCTPSVVTVSTTPLSAPLIVVAGQTTTAATMAFTSCQ